MGGSSVSHDPYPLPSDPEWQGPHPAEVILVGDDPKNVVAVVCVGRNVTLDSKSRPVATVELRTVDRDAFITAPLVGYGLTWKARIEDFVYG